MSVISCSMLGANQPTGKYVVASLDYESSGINPTIDGMVIYRGLTDYDRNYWAVSRSYGVHRFNPDGTHKETRSYDVHAAQIGPGADVMAAYLNTIPDGEIVLISTHDEPYQNHLYPALVTAMNRIGAGPLYSNSIVNRSAYVLFGRAGVGYGGGVEYYDVNRLWYIFNVRDNNFSNIRRY